MDQIRQAVGANKITGIIKVEIVDAKDIEEIREVGQLAKNVTLKTGKQWGEVELKGITHESTWTEGAYNNSLKGIFADWENVLQISLSWMRSKRYIARITDARGRKWGLGTMEEPLRFTYRKSCDQNAQGRQGTEMEFYNTSSEEVYVIQ